MARGYAYEYENRRGGRMRSLRWIAIALVVTAVLLFLLVLLTFVMQIQAFVEEEFQDLYQEYPDALPLMGAVEIGLQTCLGSILVIVCFGAGSTGIAMSEKDDATHNISLKNSLLGQTMMTFIAALLYLVTVGTVYFLLIDKYVKDFGELRDVAEWYYTSYVFVIICFVLAFIIAVLALIGYFMAFSYRPYLQDQRQASTKKDSYRNRTYERHLDRDDGDYFSDYVTDKIYPARGHIYPYRANMNMPAALNPYATYY